MTLAEIISALDKAVDWYHKSNAIVEKECGYSNGKLTGAKNVTEYETRRRAVFREYEARCKSLISQLDENITSLNSCKINFENYFETPEKYIRRWLILGELHFFYENFSRYAPLALRLPLDYPLCVESEKSAGILQIMLNLLFTFPLGLCQFHVYDPNHFGGSVGRFDVLREIPEVFPDREFLYDEKSLKQLLENLSGSFAQMRQNLFPAQNCRSWTEYNRQMRALRLPKKQLPYRVLVCFELPELCSQENVLALKRLADEGKNFGFLLIFSYNPESLEVRRSTFDGSVESLQNDRALAAFRVLHKSAVELSAAFVQFNFRQALSYLKVEETLDVPAPPHILEKYLRSYRDALEKIRSQIVDFEDLIRSDNRFDSNSVDAVKIPLGTSAQTGDVLEISIGDNTPHALIAGRTGSGKTNLLHVLITSACWHYSPEELSVFLLDFKDGVEFAAYANPVLPHARLVATQADAVFAQTVLEFLNAEIIRRNEIFKASRVTGYRAYRKNFPAAKLPRIILIVDEFQRLFDSDANAVMELLENLTKQGRSVGVHLIFATQTFKGVGGNTSAAMSFTQIKGQFGARIALKSSAEDSKDILGQNNETAADLQIPYAILNTEGGSLRYNKKFAVPEAKSEKITETLNDLVKICGVVPARIFDGQTLPDFPPAENFAQRDFSILLGRRLNFEGDDFFITLTDALEQNLLICGERGTFMACIFNFARASKLVEEIVYVSKKNLPENFSANVSTFAAPQDFFAAVRENLFDRRRLIILDSCVFPPVKTYPPPTEDDLKFAQFWQNASEHGSHIVAFYQTFNQLKDSNLDFKKIFEHRVTYHLPPSNAGAIGSFSFNNRPVDDRFKAAYFFRERLTWFSPFRF